QHLAGVVPLVEGVVDVEALVALEADQRLFADVGEDLRHLRLADARLPFEEQGPFQAEGEEDGDAEGTVGDIAPLGEGFYDFIDRPHCDPLWPKRGHGPRFGSTRSAPTAGRGLG